MRMERRYMSEHNQMLFEKQKFYVQFQNAYLINAGISSNILNDRKFMSVEVYLYVSQEMIISSTTAQMATGKQLVLLIIHLHKVLEKLIIFRPWNEKTHLGIRRMTDARKATELRLKIKRSVVVVFWKLFAFQFL